MTSFEKSAVHSSNPFCTRFVRPGALDYRFGDDIGPSDSAFRLDEIVRRLAHARTGLIVGPHGSGKTTLLHSLRAKLQERFACITHVQLFAAESTGVFARLRHARHAQKLVNAQQSQLADGGLLIVDGAEQMWRVDLSRFLDRARQCGQTVLATSHCVVPGMTVVRETENNRDLIWSLTQSLLTHASPQVMEIVQQEFRKQDGGTLTNVRDFWFELYDLVHPHILRSYELT